MNGCNSYGTNYTANSDGSITFGDFIGTEKSCINDYDYLYLNALSYSISFE